MNIADLTHLYKAISEGAVPQHLKKQMVAFDDVLYATLPENCKPPKSFLLKNITPGSLSYLVGNYNLTIAEIDDLIKFLSNVDWGKENFTNYDEYDFLVESIKESLRDISKDDFIRIYESKVLYGIIANPDISWRNIFELNRLIDIDYESLRHVLDLSYKFDYQYQSSSTVGFFSLNILWSLLQCSDSELESLFTEENLPFISKSLGETFSMRERMPFVVGQVVSEFWKRMNESKFFADKFLQCKYFEVNKNKILSRKTHIECVPEMLTLHKTNPSRIVRNYLVFIDVLTLDELVEAGIDVNYFEYSFANHEFEVFFSKENLAILKNFDGISLCHVILSKLNLIMSRSSAKEYDPTVSFSLVEIDAFLTELIIDPKFSLDLSIDPKFSLSLRVELLNLILETDFVEKEIVRFHETKDSETVAYPINLVEALSKTIKMGGETKEIVPLVAKYWKKFINFQNQNPEKNLISWRLLYSNLYSFSSENISLFDPELIKEIAVCSLKNISQSPDLLKLNFQKTNGEDSLRWLCYSPESILVKPILDTTTFNGSLLNLMLTLRKSPEVALEDGSLHDALLIASANNRVFKPVFEKILNEEYLRPYQFSTAPIDCNNNFFKIPLNDYSGDELETISHYPYFDNMLSEDLETLSDSKMAHITYLNNEYITEEFVERLFEEKFYLRKENPSFNSILELGDSILSLRLIDKLRKEAFWDVFQLNMKNPTMKHKWHFYWNHKWLFSWNLFFEYWSVESRLNERGNVSVEELETLQKYRKNILDVLDISSIQVNANFWSKKNFKRTIPFLNSDFLCKVLIENDVFLKNKFIIAEHLESVHISVLESMMDALLNRLKTMNFSARQSIACFVAEALPKESVKKYLTILFTDYPELLLSDSLNSSRSEALPDFLSNSSLIDVCEKLEKAVYGDALSFEVYLHDYVKQNYCVSIHNSSQENLEAFKAHPAGFAMLVLLPFLSNQNVISNGWSLGLNSHNATYFLAGLKIIIKRLLDNDSEVNTDFNNIESRVVLNSVFRALKLGGVTFELIKKQFLVFLRDNHLCLYLNALSELGDAETIEGFYGKFQRALIEQQIEMFESFVFSIKFNKKDKSKRMVIDLEDIYRDVIVSSSYDIIYRFFNDCLLDIDESYFFRNKLKEFVSNYTSYIKDLTYSSSRKFIANQQYFKQILIPISVSKIDNICLKKKISLAMNSEHIYEDSDNYLRVDKL